MSIDTAGAVMLNKIKGTPDSFVVQHVKIDVVLVQIMDKLDLDLVFVMGEGAIDPELAVVEVIRVKRAEFGLVFVRAVELLDPAVVVRTGIAFGARSWVIEVFAKEIRGEMSRTSPVSWVMIEGALLVVMFDPLLAREHFEGI